MTWNYHLVDFPECIADWICHSIADWDDDDRASMFETLRLMYCMFCGCRHPKGKMCSCWDGTLPKQQPADAKENK